MFFVYGKKPVFTTKNMFQLFPHMFCQPDFFVWLPHLFVKRIPCPECFTASRKSSKGQTMYLQQYGWAKRPQRITDLDRNIFLVGKQYHCGHADCGKTYQSWSPPIMDLLPHWLVAEFPFHLSHRCGLSDQLVALLRSSFQRGVGPSPFAKMIRLMHVRRYELLHAQYLEMISIRLSSSNSLQNALLAKHEPFETWDDTQGYSGYVPSPKYFSEFYNMFVEKHAAEIDQHMAMLPARILCVNHSHKVSLKSVSHVTEAHYHASIGT